MKGKVKFSSHDRQRRRGWAATEGVWRMVEMPEGDDPYRRFPTYKDALLVVTRGENGERKYTRVTTYRDGNIVFDRMIWSRNALFERVAGPVAFTLENA